LRSGQFLAQVFEAVLTGFILLLVDERLFAPCICVRIDSCVELTGREQWIDFRLRSAPRARSPDIRLEHLRQELPISRPERRDAAAVEAEKQAIGKLRGCGKR